MTTPQPAALPELTPLTGDIQIQDRTIYVLNKNGENLWWATVSPGFHDNGVRVSDDQCRAVAADLARLAALQSQPAATTKVGAPSGMLRTTCPYCENGFAFEQPAAAGVSDAEIDRAAQIMANDRGYGWPHIPESWKEEFRETARAVLALRPQAVPMTDADAVQVYGIKNGQQTLLGTAPMPSRMKARELAREQFGHFEDGDGSDADLCFYALEQLIEHMERSAHHGITAQGAQGEQG